MFNRQKQQGDPPQVVAAKRASLAIAWGIAAGVAYLGLIYRVVKVIVDATNGQWSGGMLTRGSSPLGRNSRISAIRIAKSPPL